MPFIPHTEEEVQAMLADIGASSIDDLFDEIPEGLIVTEDDLKSIPQGLPEMDVARLMQSRARKDGHGVCFIGAGAYDHHIPAAVWQITTRGEFYSAYTPYQAEASQGTLQLLYEYQSMMTSLMDMDVSNASLYAVGFCNDSIVFLTVEILSFTASIYPDRLSAITLLLPM